MYQPRNPFTPLQGEIFTPVQYLERTLAFYQWYRENSIKHLESCRLDNHQEVLINGFCCLNYLKQCIDFKLLEVAGCQTGIWHEPEGFQVWLSFAWKRLEELEEGHDYYDLWTTTLRKESQGIYAWIHNIDSADTPGFSLATFRNICQKFGYSPGRQIVLRAFC